MNTIRRGLKRKEPEREEEYQAGLTQFQVRISKIYSQSVVSELGAKKNNNYNEIYDLWR